MAIDILPICFQTKSSVLIDALNYGWNTHLNFELYFDFPTTQIYCYHFNIPVITVQVKLLLRNKK